MRPAWEYLQWGSNAGLPWMPAFNAAVRKLLADDAGFNGDRGSWRLEPGEPCPVAMRVLATKDFHSDTEIEKQVGYLRAALLGEPGADLDYSVHQAKELGPFRSGGEGILVFRALPSLERVFTGVEVFKIWCDVAWIPKDLIRPAFLPQPWFVSQQPIQESKS